MPIRRLTKTNEDWKDLLTPEEYNICRMKGTERPFTGLYNNTKTKGTYVCTCCGEKLFSSDSKFDSGSGWPSFYKVYNEDAIQEIRDESHGMLRVEVLCAVCDSHLGHVFPDGPKPTGMRYCINSASLSLEEES
jgi:peptide-methionine (R)-S-oxide reductase